MILNTKKIVSVTVVLLLIVILSVFIFRNEFARMLEEEQSFTNKLTVGFKPLKLEFNDFGAVDSISILSFGDGGKGNFDQYMVASAMWDTCQREKCDLGIGLGDNFYPAGVSSLDDQQWTSAFENPYQEFVNNPFTQLWMVVGNHDRRGNVEAQIEYSKTSQIWRMPASDYKVPGLPSWLNIYTLDTSFVAPGADFPVYDAKIRQNFKQQLQRAGDHLCGKRGWKVLLTHHPLYSNGRKKNAFREKNLREALLPFIKNCGVNLILSGHEHLQQHLKAETFDMIIQGAAADVRLEFKTIDDEIYSQFLGTERGFSILNFSEEVLDIKFYNEKGDYIYKTSVESG